MERTVVTHENTVSDRPPMRATPPVIGLCSLRVQTRFSIFVPVHRVAIRVWYSLPCDVWKRKRNHGRKEGAHTREAQNVFKRDLPPPLILPTTKATARVSEHDMVCIVEGWLAGAYEDSPV